MSLFDLSNVVLTLSSHDITVTRWTAPGYTAEGRAIPRAVATRFTVRGSFQPRAGAGFKETLGGLQKNSEGVRTGESGDVWVPRELFPGDYIKVSGIDYEVIAVDAWGANGNYWQGNVRRLDPNEARP